MLLQLTTPKPTFNLHFHDPFHVDFSSNSSYSLKFPSGFRESPILGPIKIHKNSVFSCYNRSKGYGNRTVDYEKKAMYKWKALYKRITFMEDQSKGVAGVLNKWENEGKSILKSELCRIVKELRKFKRFKFALEVFEWMNSRGERFTLTSSDTAILLDLIAKVCGTSSAEQYFMKLPGSLKDKRIYGALLNVYVQADMKQKAEALMDIMKTRGYASNSLPYNVIMTLYMKMKEINKVESVISEMMEKNIPLDIYSYNIWLSSCGSISLEKMEEVLEQMKLDTSIYPNWTTFSTMATLYIQFGEVERAEDCLKKIEGRITGRDRIPYHYLISLYGTIGKRDDVYRVWKLYKSLFLNIPNFGYYAMISSLVRLDDIEGAEKIYEEWLSVKSMYEPRIGNLLFGWYVRKGFTDNARLFYDQMIEAGGKANTTTWEIFAEIRIKERRISEAVNCFKNAILADGSKRWRPNPKNVSSLLNICEEEGDLTSKETLLELLRQMDCLEDKSYTSLIPIKDGSFSGDERSQSHLNAMGL